MYTKVLVIMDLISQIIELPMQGGNPSQYFHAKDNDKLLATKLKKKYGMDRDKREYVVDTINDHAVRVATNFFYIKVVRKNCPNQSTSRVIACAEQ